MAFVGIFGGDVFPHLKFDGGFIQTVLALQKFAL
jgi:hypothetical protein